VPQQPAPATENNGSEKVPQDFIRDSSDLLLEAFNDETLGKIFEQRLAECFDEIVDYLKL